MSKKLILVASSAVSLLALPLVTLAVFNPGPPPNTINVSIPGLVDLLFSGFLWPVAVAFFIVMFVIAAFQFFTAQGNPEGVAKARQFVIWGIVGVVVAVLAFSIPFIVRNMFPGA